MRPRLTRRRLIATSAAGIAGGLAGCIGNENDDSGSNPESESMEGTGMDSDDSGMNGDGMSDGSMSAEPTDPATAETVAVDRFSDEAGMLQQRSKNDAFPGPDEPIDFDGKPFRHTGLGPDGQQIRYYNFDVQPTTPAPIYTLVREDGSSVDQPNVIGVIPGDDGYNDFWHVHKATVPEDYEANTATSVESVEAVATNIEETGKIKNCPVVPEGSTAELRHENDDSPTDPVMGWYEDQVVYYFLFGEMQNGALAAASGSVPTSPIYVTFNKNPGQDGGGPPSGFMTEEGSAQNHNVVATVPEDDAYSPLWAVNIYDNADFEDVSDIESARNTNILNGNGPTVNCPVVFEE